MTVKYTDKVASHGGFGSFFKLLLRWRGSVYKMVWEDMVVYILLYYIISLTYRFGLGEDQKRTFEMLVIHCTRFRNLIPVSFVLGFFVSLVVSRWWATYQTLPWPDTTAILLATHLPGQDADSKRVRSTVLRYINLVIVMTFASVSPAVKNKFPTLNTYVNAGYLTQEESQIMENLENQTSKHKTWVPIMWACKVIEKARKEEHISSDSHQRTLVAEVLNVRSRCGGLMGYNEYSIPLVYTQVVTIAVYSFFVFSLIGEQFLDPGQNHKDHNIDLYIPIFAFLQLFFYIGWLKVAEALLNPFGDDDHDFEFLPLLDRHREMSTLLSDPSESDLPSSIVDRPEKLNMKIENLDGDLTAGQKDSPVETVVTSDSNATYFSCQVTAT